MQRLWTGDAGGVYSYGGTSMAAQMGGHGENAAAGAKRKRVLFRRGQAFQHEKTAGMVLPTM